MHNYHIHIHGLVQGVGFRPFVYRIAQELGIAGQVCNNNEGVCIEINGTSDQKEALLKRLEQEKPIASSIQYIEVKEMPLSRIYHTFNIVPSESDSEEVTRISPDIAVCEECLNDMKVQGFRQDYPFINCTNCGPRFTIINDLPYDRSQTSMHSFRMCDRCKEEYEQVTNRRFHAQPVACNTCGPAYYLVNGKEAVSYHPDTPAHLIKHLVSRLNRGEVISLKGLGGFNLMCDAFNPEALSALRKIKQREGKPFALLFRSLETLRKYAAVSAVEERELTSWRRPIVLVTLTAEIPKAINGDLKTLGVLLPYLPIHHLLFEQSTADAFVLTSGNLCNEPIIIDNEEALQRLGPLVDLQVFHNREIVNRADDSIVQVISEIPRLIRRARGYVPDPHVSSLYTEGILACGAEKVNTFAIGKKNEIILSQYIGDLQEAETQTFYKEAVNRFSRLFRFSPTAVSCDLHPDYAASRYAEKLSTALNLPLFRIQHHHAHAVACMEEHRLTDSVLGIILDGTGYGTDGKIWGGEFMICNHREFRREDHLPYIPLPGGEQAIRQPWRSALAFCKKYEIEISPELLARYGEKNCEGIFRMIDKGINAPESCGAGRIFDAVASLVGICDRNTFQAEAPLRLEHLAENDFLTSYEINNTNPLELDLLFQGITEDLEHRVSPGRIAAKFHNTLVRLLVKKTEMLLDNYHTPRDIVLTGGCFQNKRLSQQLEEALRRKRLNLYVPQRFPANDGGIALGQLAIAATLRTSDYA